MGGWVTKTIFLNPAIRVAVNKKKVRKWYREPGWARNARVTWKEIGMSRKNAREWQHTIGSSRPTYPRGSVPTGVVLPGPRGAWGARQTEAVGGAGKGVAGAREVGGDLRLGGVRNEANPSPLLTDPPKRGGNAGRLQDAAAKLLAAPGGGSLNAGGRAIPHCCVGDAGAEKKGEEKTPLQRPPTAPRAHTLDKRGEGRGLPPAARERAGVTATSRARGVLENTSHIPSGGKGGRGKRGHGANALLTPGAEDAHANAHWNKRVGMPCVSAQRGGAALVAWREGLRGQVGARGGTGLGRAQAFGSRWGCY